MIFDKTGRRLMVGQLIDLNMAQTMTPDGMFTGTVVHIEEPSVITKKQGLAVVQVVVQLPIALHNGKESVPGYIIREAPKEGLMPPNQSSGPQRIVTKDESKEPAKEPSETTH